MSCMPLVRRSMPVMTGNPGIPPGWVMVKCWTGWAIRDKVMKKMAATAGTNDGIRLEAKALLRFMMWKASVLPVVGVA